MGAKDVTEKILEARPEIFADIINGLVFHGRQVVRPEDLEDVSPVSMYKADGQIHEQERDVAKYWKNNIWRLALFGVENQTQYEKEQPLRNIGYDGAGYRSQLSAKHFYPVFTLTLYFGKTHWNANRCLREVLDFPEDATVREDLMSIFNDYRLNLYEIAFLTEEQLNFFQSDFRVIAEYFVRSRTNPGYVPEPREIKYVDEVLKLLSVMAKDKRFEEVLNAHKQGEEIQNMSDVLDFVERKATTNNLYEYVSEGGMTADYAAKKAGVTRDAFLTNMKAAGWSLPVAGD